MNRKRFPDKPRGLRARVLEANRVASYQEVGKAAFGGWLSVMRQEYQGAPYLNTSWDKLGDIERAGWTVAGNAAVRYRKATAAGE